MLTLLNCFTIFIFINCFYPLLHANIRNKRIVGGNRISINTIPYIVSIQERLFQVHICGGSIISQLWILTAAHCPITVNKANGRYFVVVGGNFKARNHYHITRAIKHEKFSRLKKDYDIALLKLDRRITKESGGAIIDLSRSDVGPGDVVRVSGWGWDENKNIDVLKAVNLDIFDHDKCKRIYMNGAHITQNMICAAREGKDACNSDSGGPMTITKNNKDVLVGIVSWGEKCGSRIYPGVYTKVSSFLPWISDVQNRYQ